MSGYLEPATEIREAKLSAIIEYGEHSLSVPLKLFSKQELSFLGFSYTDEGSTILALERGDFFLSVESLIKGPVTYSRFLKRRQDSAAMSVLSVPFALGGRRQSPFGDLEFWVDKYGRLALYPPFTISLSGKYSLGGAFKQSFRPIYYLDSSSFLAKLADIEL